MEGGARTASAPSTTRLCPQCPAEVPLGHPCKALHSSLLGGKELDKLVPTKVSVADSLIPVS